MATTRLPASRVLVLGTISMLIGLALLVTAVRLSTPKDAGFFVVDLGGLREGGQMQQVGAPLAGHNLIRLP